MLTAPYGAWPSPISIDDLTSSSVGLSEPRIDGDRLYWLESRPDQGGRTSLWSTPLGGGDRTELTPDPAYVRTRVHEYGGGAYAVRDGVVVYSEVADGRLYRIKGAGTSVALTPEGDQRYADLRVHPDRGLVLAVREDHSGEGEPENTLVAVPLDGPGPVRVIASGADFYAGPEWSASGRIAWCEWNHPFMPWDSTSIVAGRFDGKTVTDLATVAGGERESAVYPVWLGESLVFASDRSDWWNLYAWQDRQVEALCPQQAEFCGPAWVFGSPPYAVLGEDLVCVVSRGGSSRLAVLEAARGRLVHLTDEPVGAAGVAAGAGTIAAVLRFPGRPSVLVEVDPRDGSRREVRRSREELPDPAGVSVAEAVSWRNADGEEVYAWYYPPTNAEVTAPAGSLPPLITLTHGGPTACAGPDYSTGYQFWTSRGYALLDVNYGGSSGFGRRYRERLNGNWGLVDVADCADGARAMADQGRADPARLVIKGGSAGGYTTLRALTATDTFAVGISLYGIGDLEALATDTHKFESHYHETLVAPYPQERATYRDRSPIDHLDQLSAPILLLQGLDDKVVPPNQAELMADAARAKGLPVAVLMFAGEGHGFRRAETLRAATEAQLSFLGQILGFTPADEVPTLPIENLG